MKKTLSRRTFLKTAGLASAAGVVGCREALGGTTQSPALPKSVLAYRNVIKTKDIRAYSHAALSLRRWMMRNDPHYPIYHFAGPESWINDPNGPIYYSSCPGISSKKKARVASIILFLSAYDLSVVPPLTACESAAVRTVFTISCPSASTALPISAPSSHPGICTLRVVNKTALEVMFFDSPGCIS